MDRSSTVESTFYKQAFQILSPAKILPHIPKRACHAGALDLNHRIGELYVLHETLDGEEVWLNLFCFSRDCLPLVLGKRLFGGKRVSTAQAVKNSIHASSQQFHS